MRVAAAFNFEALLGNGVGLDDFIVVIAILPE
jgi:hypothetical protein